jgi:hypothetical protein
LTLLPAEGHPAWAGLRDLAFLLGEDAASLAGRLAPATAVAIGYLVRGMNCYYSNLIEGHDTRPIASPALDSPFRRRQRRRRPLLSHALLRRAGVGSPLWSVARGLARNVAAYRAYLARADDPPQALLDGRGILSDGRLAEFCRFFLAACVDQVRFMRALLSPEALAGRVREFVAAEAAGWTAGCNRFWSRRRCSAWCRAGTCRGW